MKKPWWLLGSFALLFLVLGVYLFTLPVEKPHLAKISILVINDSRLTKVEGLKNALEDLGYLEGQDVIYEITNAHDDFSGLTLHAQQMLNKNRPDILIAGGGVEAQVLKKITASLESPPPVVFMGTLSPVEIGLVSNLAHPIGNLTGLNNYHYELTSKRLEILHRMLPEVQRVAVLGDAQIPFFREVEQKIKTEANYFDFTILMYEASSSVELKRAFKEMKEARAQAIILLPGFFLETSTGEIVGLAMENKLPVFGVYPSDAQKGCLASYGTSYYSQGAQSAHLVHKLLRGQNPGDIPIETPETITFSVNLKTAQTFGIEPTTEVLSFADEIIKP